MISGHHPKDEQGIDSHEAFLVAACRAHGSHTLRLRSRDDMAWLVAETLQREFGRQGLRCEIARWQESTPEADPDAGDIDDWLSDLAREHD